LRLAGGGDRRLDFGGRGCGAPHNLAALDGGNADDIGHDFLLSFRGASKLASPESINTRQAVCKGCGIIEKIVVMDSGLLRYAQSPE
jgi:hypothetical protein